MKSLEMSEMEWEHAAALLWQVSRKARTSQAVASRLLALRERILTGPLGLPPDAERSRRRAERGLLHQEHPAEVVE